MSTDIIQRLNEFKIELNGVPRPGGSYVSVNVRGNIAFVAVQFPIIGDEFLYQGRLGEDLSTLQGYDAARLCAINILSQVNHYIGFDRIEGLNHLDIYYQQAGSWDDGPIVANGASDLFVNILADKGLHTRAIFGVQNLPRNFSVSVTSSFTLK